MVHISFPLLVDYISIIINSYHIIFTHNIYIIRILILVALYIVYSQFIILYLKKI